jgi:lipoprotein-releasing system permease protein
VHLPLFLAQRFLRKQKGSFSAFIIRLAAGATALSVAVMLIAAAIVTGFQSTIEEKIHLFWGHLLITPYSANPAELMSDVSVFRDFNTEAQMTHAVGKAPITPYALQPAILRTPTALEGIQLKGIPAGYSLPAGTERMGGQLDFSDTAYSKDILLSRTTADRLELKPGNELQLYFLHEGSSLPRIRKLRVAGIYHTGLDEVDRNFALCDIRLVQRLAGWAPSEITGYQIDLPRERAAEAEELAQHFYDAVLPATLRAYTLPERYPQLFDWLRLQATNVRVLLGIMALIAIINLAAALLILMVDRARTVGLLQALGMSRGALMQLFIALAGGIGLLGCILGTGVALLLCGLQKATGFMKLPEETYYMHTVPVEIVGWHILLINGATLVLCLVCMSLPALYLRRLSPTKVLQFK